MKEIGPRPPGPHPHPLHWAEVRFAALARDNGCRACGSLEQLEVHHRTYARFGREAVDDLTTLCRGCHDLITGAQMRMRDERRVLPLNRQIVSIERFDPAPAHELPLPKRNVL